MPLGKSTISSLVVLAVIVVAIGYIWWSFEKRRLGSALDGREVYEALIISPVPNSVHDIQAAGTSWQGYSVYMRFRAPSLAAAGITEPPYVTTECDQISARLVLPDHLRSSFTPAWLVDGSDHNICSRADEVENVWTTLGGHYLMRIGDWVYFYGSGS